MARNGRSGFGLLAAGVVLAVVIFAASPGRLAEGIDREQTITGRVVDVSPDAGTLELLVGEPVEEVVVCVTPETAVVEGDRARKLAEVPMGAEVRASFEMVDGRRVARQVEILQAETAGKGGSGACDGGYCPLPREAEDEHPPGSAAGSTTVGSSPGTVTGEGSALGGSHASDTPGSGLQPGQPDEPVVPRQEEKNDGHSLP